jgi:L-asparagine transporter-like permease
MNTAAFNSDEMLETMAAEAVKRQAQVRSAVRDITL